MSLFSALLLAATPAVSDFSIARDAFTEVCRDLTSIRAVEQAARSHGWQAFEPAHETGIGNYIASARLHWSGVTFHPIRRVVAGRSLEILYFEQPDRGEIGDGLHCSLFMDDGTGFPTDEILSWSTSQPDNMFMLEIAGDDGDFWRRPLLQWRPGVYASHDITTVEFNPPGDSSLERIYGVGINIWAINLPPGRED